jgi:hypothetical protein
MSLVSKAFSDIVTFSRSSNATRIGPTGRVEYAPHNLLLRSQEFGTWTTEDILSVTDNSVAAPNGTITASLVIPNTANNDHSIYRIPGLSGALQTFSVYAKAAGYNYVFLGYNNNNDNEGVFFNLQNGTVSKNTSSMSATIESAGNGWYRCSVTYSVGFTYTICCTSQNGTSIVHTGDGTSGIYLWGAQLSVGPYPLDYTPTTSAAVYGPRFDYDPVTLAARGLLVEEQRSNLLTYSEQFDNAAWTKNFLSVTANSLSAPDGTVTADKLVDTAANDLHRVISSSFSSGTYTISVYAKAGERTKIEIVTQPVDAKFDLSNGTVISGTGASIVSVGNGWYRCVLTFTQSISSSVGYGLLDASGNRTYTGDGTSGAYLWGAQLEAGSFSTSYIPTVAATVTRSADVASVNTLSPWMNQTEGTIFAEYSFYGADAAFNNTAVMLTDGTENNYEALFGYTPAYGWVQSGGATSAGLTTGGATAINTNYKSALAFKANDFAFSINGASPATDTSGTVPTVTEMLLGRRVASSKPLHGHLRRVAFFPRRLSNAELQALTA